MARCQTQAFLPNLSVLHVVGFSGGIASAVTAQLGAEEHEGNTVLLYHDTRTEPPDNDRFRAEVAAHIGLPITEDSDGRNIWQVFQDEGMLGNGRNTPCSRILKQERSLAYLRTHMPAVLYLGFTADEWRRAQRSWARYAKRGIEVRFPLVERKITKDQCWTQVAKCWKIALPAMYEWADHANCIPCIKGKLAYWGLVAMHHPEAWERAASTEEAFGHTIFTEAGTLRQERDHCLELAKKRLAVKREERESLMEMPCECA